MASTASPPRLSRAESKEATRRSLLDAAERCFLKLGYPGSTLDAIAGEAGFTKGAVYWHFRSKEALFLELLVKGTKRNADEAAEIVGRLEKAPERLDEELGKWFDEFDRTNNVPLLALEMDLESRRNPTFSALLDEVVGKQLVAVTNVLARYFEASRRTPPMPLRELAMHVIALSKSVALARQTRHSADLTTAKVMRLLLGMPAAETTAAA